MCLGATGYAQQLTGNVNQTKKNVDELFGWNQKDPTPPTVNVYNTLPGGDIVKAGSNRTSLQTGPYSSRTERM